MNNFILSKKRDMNFLSDEFRFFKDDIHKSIVPVFCKSGCSTIGTQICFDNNIPIHKLSLYFWATSYANSITLKLNLDQFKKFIYDNNYNNINIILRNPTEKIISKINWVHYSSENWTTIYQDPEKKEKYINDIIEYIEYNIQEYLNHNKYDPHAIPDKIIIDRFLTKIECNKIYENLSNKRFDIIFNETKNDHKLIYQFDELTINQQTKIKELFHDDYLLWNKVCKK